MIFKVVNLGLRAIGHHTETTEVRDESWKLWCLLLDLAMLEAVSQHVTLSPRQVFGAGISSSGNRTCV